MSAIAGFWNSSARFAPLEQCRAMLAAQRQYGPHASNAVNMGDIALGRNLFRLLPEDAADAQPLTGAGGRYLLVADLRLDNRQELLDRLGRREDPALSDAAILLLGIERWQAGILDHILGDYAFALWDRDESVLLLARDPLGQRPLHYHRASGFFAFASMPMGLHALDEIPRRPDIERLAEMVGGIPLAGTHTYYERVERVEPGHLFSVTASGTASRRYWTPVRRNLGLKGFDDYRDAFRAELDRSVGSRLRGADGKVAAHLSSGWDSSSVAATAAELLRSQGGRVVAFTSVPRPGNRSGAPGRRIVDEGPIAAATAALHDNMEHVLIEGSGKSPLANLDRIVSLFDRPLLNLCNNVWMSDIRDAARDSGARVLLTGEVGNWSISASPPALLADLLREGRWASWWHEARAKVRNGDARYRGIAANSFGPWLPKPIWNLFRRFSSAPESSQYSAIHPRLARDIERKREAWGALLSRPTRNSFKEAVRGLSGYDYGNFRKGALAGWGLDERDPTGDRRLIEFCISLPIDMLLKDGVRRPLARAALADRLPPAVLEERRKGYQAADWHEGVTGHLDEISQMVERIAANPAAASIIDVDTLRAWVNNWPTGGWEDLPVMARYRSALLQALATGHFILRATAAV